MKRILLLQASVAAIFLFMSVAPEPARAANCAKNPDHPSCPDPGDGGSTGDRWPSTIVFADAFGDGLTSDGAGDYVDNVDGAEAFIGGSGPKVGDILLRLLNSPRTVRLDFSTMVTDPNDPSCAPPPIDNVDQFVLHDLQVKVNQATSQGVYNLGSSLPNVDVEMRILFRDANDELWFLNYGGGARRLCDDEENNDTVRVTEPEDGVDSWTVETLSDAASACLEKFGSGQIKTKFCGSYTMPFSFTVTPLP